MGVPRTNYLQLSNLCPEAENFWNPSSKQFKLARNMFQAMRWMLTAKNSLLLLAGLLKAKAVPLHATQAIGERRYSSYSFLTSTLDGGELSASRPVCDLPTGKGPPVPIVQEAGWAPEPVWTQRLEGKPFCLCRGSKLDCLVVWVSRVASHYTD
jgi:hypothetical protein